MTHHAYCFLVFFVQLSSFSFYSVSKALNSREEMPAADKRVHRGIHIFFCWEYLPISKLWDWSGNWAFQSAGVCVQLSWDRSEAKRLAICPAIMSGPHVIVQTWPISCAKLKWKRRIMGEDEKSRQRMGCAGVSEEPMGGGVMGGSLQGLGENKGTDRLWGEEGADFSFFPCRCMIHVFHWFSSWPTCA